MRIIIFLDINDINIIYGIPINVKLNILMIYALIDVNKLLNLFF